jgi:hypothetical protein
MRPLMVAIIYFGTFLTIGYFAKKLFDGLMARHGADLDDVQKQAGPNRKPREVFLLGAWRTERD